MNISFVGTVSSSIFGFRRELLKELVRRGHEVTIYTADWSEAVAVRARKELGITAVRYPLARSGVNPFADLRSTWFLYREFRRLKPDVVFSYFSKPVIWGSLAAWLANVPWRVGMLEGLGYVFTQQPDGRVPTKQRVLKAVQVLLYRLALPRLHQMIFLNPDDPVDLLETHRINVARNSVLGGIGVDLKALPYSAPPVARSQGVIRNITFIFIGRILAEKGVNEYIAAARLVKQRYPHARFVVLGGLDEENPGGLTQKELNALVAQELLEYPGHVDNVSEWLRDADVFVLPSSYREGVPASTQEAMAIGRTVITTDAPGCRETVVDGVNGFLVPPWSPSALAEKMVYLVEHPQKIVEMGKQSRRLAEQKFNVVEVNQRLCELLLPSGEG